MRGQVTGTTPGDSVKVWFTRRRATSGASRSPTGCARTRGGGARARGGGLQRLLDVPGVPTEERSRTTSSYYTEALDANGVAHDVYDYDAMGRKAPDPLGVLSHYDAVIWYTGNDNVTRSPNGAGRGGPRGAPDDHGGARLRERGRPRGVQGVQRRPAVGPRGVPAGGLPAVAVRRRPPDDGRRQVPAAVERLRPVLPRGVPAKRRRRAGRGRERLPGAGHGGRAAGRADDAT